MPETVTVTSDFAAAPISLWRRGVNAFATFAAGAAVVLVLLPLGAVFGYLIYKGIGSINWAFLTQTPKPDRKSVV
jgi:phosphate transport system permease protein